MENKKQTSLDWYFDKIKSHFEHDGDLFETSTFTYSIAKQKEKQQFIDFFKWVIDNTEKNINLTVEQFVEKYYKENY